MQRKRQIGLTGLAATAGTDGRYPREGSGLARRRSRPTSRRIPAWALLSLVLVVTGGCARAPEVPPAGVVDPGDDAHLVIFYGSEVMGSLEGCGCMGNPRLGGLPYRMGFTKAYREANPNVAILQVDAGFPSSLITNAQQFAFQDTRAQMDETFRALAETDFAAINVTEHDIPFVSRYLQASGEDAAPDVRGRLVAANVEAVAPGTAVPSPYVVRTVEGCRLPGDSVRVAIVGATGFPSRLDAATGYRVVDPGPALERAIAQARREADLVVLLAYMPAAEADRRLAALASSPDIVIVANSFGSGSADGSTMGGGLEARLDGPVRVVYSWYKTQKLGVLRLKLDGAKRILEAKNAYVKMDDPVPWDPAAAALVDRQKAAVRAAREARFQAG